MGLLTTAAQVSTARDLIAKGGVQSPIDISKIIFPEPWDSWDAFWSGNALPSLSFLRLNSIAFGLLMLCILAGVFSYMLLTISAARLDGKIMNAYWQVGFFSIWFQIFSMILSCLYWC